MALYFYCETNERFEEAEKALLEEFGWKKHKGQFYSQDDKDYVQFSYTPKSVQVKVGKMQPCFPETPLPRDQAPKVFIRLLEILEPKEIRDNVANGVEISDLIIDKA
jgi:hypothetical protein